MDGGELLPLLSYRNMYSLAGSFSRSAVNFMSGCQTTVSNIVMSLVVMLTLLLITPLFKYTPNAILSSIIISAVIGLIDYEAALRIWKVDKFDFIACMGAFLGVVFVSVEIGLLIAVRIYLIFIFPFIIAAPLWWLLIISSATKLFLHIGFYFTRKDPPASNKAKDCFTWESSKNNSL